MKLAWRNTRIGGQVSSQRAGEKAAQAKGTLPAASIFERDRTMGTSKRRIARAAQLWTILGCIALPDEKTKANK